MRTGKKQNDKKQDNRRQNQRRNRRFAVIAASVLAVSGIGAGGFSMMTEGTVQAAMVEAEKIPTSYHVPAVREVPEIPEVSEERAEVNYHVHKSEFYEEEPTAVDLSMEEAAALGVQYLEEIMDFDAEGADVYMEYYGGTITFPRAFWSGDVRFGKQEKTDEDTWSFFVDAVTGELFMIGCSETLDVDVPLGYDSSLEDNCGVYIKAAEDLAERVDLLGVPVKEVVYGSQGYGSNNPDITMEVRGDNGQTAYVTFSRYNRRLLGIITGSSSEITEKALEDLENGVVDSEDVEIVYLDGDTGEMTKRE